MFSTLIVSKQCSITASVKGFPATIEAWIPPLISYWPTKATCNEDHEQCNEHDYWDSFKWKVKRCRALRRIDIMDVHEPKTQEQPQEGEDLLGAANGDLFTDSW